jgi:starch synthase
LASRSLINTLSVTSECVPLIKTGGLADVAGALPKVLKKNDIAVRTLLPGYPAVLKAVQSLSTLTVIDDCFGGSAQLLAGTHQDLDLLILDAPHLYKRDHGIYLDHNGEDWSDNIERFAALSRVAADIANGLVDDWQPDIVHCHDWQAGLAPYYMKVNKAKARSIMTIHNIAFQGIAPARKRRALGILPKDFNSEGIEYFGNISTLKAGLIYADKLTTVSPTYAQELMTNEFGMGMEGVLRYRKNDFTGILNGIDESIWSPEVDPEIINYKSPRGKNLNKIQLQKEFNLSPAKGPLCVVVSRLSEQKGLDILLEALPTLLSRDGQLILLGSGDSWLENEFRNIPHANVSVFIGYDEKLSHLMIAGADAILVPSRFEPCGLTQLYGLRYGTLPVVSSTGGLADTVVSASPAAIASQVATGIQFNPITPLALSQALTKLCDLYEQPKLWSKLQRNAMKQSVGWEDSGHFYARLYKELLI